MQNPPASQNSHSTPSTAAVSLQGMQKEVSAVCSTLAHQGLKGTLNDAAVTYTLQR